MTFVKCYRFHFHSKIGETLNPGSIFELEDDMARQFVLRGLGELSDGPSCAAPPPPARAFRDGKLIQTLQGIEEELTRPSVEREDLASKLHKAEKMVSPAQRSG